MLWVLKNLLKYINAVDCETKKYTQPYTNPEGYHFWEIPWHEIACQPNAESVVPFLIDNFMAANKNCLKGFMKDKLVSILQAENLFDINLNNHENYYDLPEVDIGVPRISRCGGGEQINLHFTTSNMHIVCMDV